MKIPYSEVQLMLAGMKANNKMEEYAKLHGEDKLMAKMEEIGNKNKDKTPQNKAEMNKLTAEYHGITVDTLVNSPNYAKLNDEFALSIMDRFRQDLKDEFGLDEVETYAVIATAQGLIG